MTNPVLEAAPSLGVVLHCLDPHVPHPPKVEVDVKSSRDRNNGNARWVTSWQLTFNLDRDGGDTEHLEIECDDDNGLTWRVPDHEGYGLESLISYLLDRPISL